MVLSGQRIVTSQGAVAIVAFVLNGAVYVYGRDGYPQRVRVRYDAFGGEHDQSLGCTQAAIAA